MSGSQRRSSQSCASGIWGTRRFVDGRGMGGVKGSGGRTVSSDWGWMVTSVSDFAKGRYQSMLGELFPCQIDCEMEGPG